MKRVLFAMFVLLAAGATLHAEGTPETADPANAQPVTVTGKIAVDANGLATIADGARTYGLLYPRSAAAGLAVKPGDTITVTGYAVPGPRWSDGKTTFLRVTQAEIGGKTYVVPGGMRGPRRGDGPGRDDGCWGGRGSMGGRGRRW